MDGNSPRKEQTVCMHLMCLRALDRCGWQFCMLHGFAGMAVSHIHRNHVNKEFGVKETFTVKHGVNNVRCLLESTGARRGMHK